MCVLPGWNPTCRPQNHRTRVLFISGYTGDAVDDLPADASDRLFLQRPFPPEALVAAVERLLGPRIGDLRGADRPR